MEQPHPNNQEIYDRSWTAWTDMKVHGPASRWLRYLMGELLTAIPASAPPATVLDFGCGEGTNTAFLADRFPQASVRGCDFSEAGIACARLRWPRPNLRFDVDREGKCLEHAADLVTCLEVLEHIEDWSEQLARLAAAAGTYLLLSFPCGRMRRFETNVGHVRNFRRGQVEARLAELSLHPVRAWYAGFPFYSPLYRELCNLTNAGGNAFTRGQYGRRQRLVAAVFYALFRYLSTRRSLGDQFCGLFRQEGR